MTICYKTYCLDADTEAKIDKFVHTIMECRNVVGMTVAAVKEGETDFTRGYGIKNLESKLPVTEHTLFDIGSTTKAFATTLLGILLDEHG